jgi:hypothetical protein
VPIEEEEEHELHGCNLCEKCSFCLLQQVASKPNKTHTPKVAECGGTTIYYGADFCGEHNGHSSRSSTAFMATEGSLQCKKNLATVPYLK